MISISTADIMIDIRKILGTMKVQFRYYVVIIVPVNLGKR